MQSVTLFEDIFEISALNPDGYKFENVNRVQATGATFECELLLDINCSIYNLREKDKFTLVLAPTLHLDGAPADHFSYESHSGPSLADHYDYVMHGRLYSVTYCCAQNWEEYEDQEGRTKFRCRQTCGCDATPHLKMDRFVILAISFGGLLMRLVGDPRHLVPLTAEPTQQLYLLLKKD